MTQVFFSPYRLKSAYWLIASGPDAVLLSDIGGTTLYHNAELFGVKLTTPWVDAWNAMVDQHRTALLAASMQIALISAEELPTMQEIELSLRSGAEIVQVAENLWLAEALEEKRLTCSMQQVVDAAQQIVGYEAFARIIAADGTVIDGGKIMAASRALHMEYQVDRTMHKEAIGHFADAGLPGIIFINFLTGFIHRPEVYLDGLNQAVEKQQLSPESVVLDIPLPAYAENKTKLESIVTYCRTRGFLTALDDITSSHGLEEMLQLLKPAYVKLDARLARGDPAGQHVLQIVHLSHASGALVLAEGVETEADYLAYQAVGVDRFQGYYFGMPVPCCSAASTPRCA